MAKVDGKDGTGFVYKKDDKLWLYKQLVSGNHMIFSWNDMIGWIPDHEPSGADIDSYRKCKIEAYVDSPYHTHVGVLESTGSISIDWSVPRIKISEIVPTFNHSKGDVIQFSDGAFKFERYNERPVGLDMDSIPKYKHLFRIMDWFEDRKLETLPLYLKIGDAVYKVDHWENDFGTRPVSTDMETEELLQNFLSMDWHFNKSKSEPATIYDYESYKVKGLQKQALIKLRNHFTSVQVLTSP